MLIFSNDNKHIVIRPAYMVFMLLFNDGKKYIDSIVQTVYMVWMLIFSDGNKHIDIIIIQMVYVMWILVFSDHGGPSVSRMTLSVPLFIREWLQGDPGLAELCTEVAQKTCAGGCLKW